ncbi:MAG: PAS domain S-box protein [Sedimentisphaerales bacterium]
MLDTVAVPEQFEPIFQKAQEYVSTYFSQKKEDASRGTIEVFGQRYILVRAASMSVDFFDTIKGMFKDWGEEKASEMARSLLFDVAHTIGKMDARNFHQRMGLQDPIEKLSAGPIHFSHTGWAFVDIFAESKPTTDENYYLIYDHPFSFEADAWEKSGKKNISCVCTMNAGYSSGWCEESFGIPLVASEIMCKARGDSACRFIMAHPSRISQYLQAYLRSHPEIPDNATLYRTGGFFQDFKQAQEDLRNSEERFKQVAENAGDWIWEVNAEGLYTYSSPVVEKVLGYKPGEIVEKKYFYDLFAPDVKEKLKKTTFDAFAQRESIKNFVNPKVHKNGYIVILEANSTPIVDDKGNFCGYRGACRDITARKEVEERLLAVNTLQGLLLPPLPIEQKLKFVTDAVVRILDADFARIWVIKPGDRCEAGCTHAEAKEGPHVCRFRDKCLHLMASSGRYTHLDGKDHCRVPFGCYKIGLIAAGEQDKFLTNEAATDPRVHNPAWAKELDLVSFAGYRLTHTDGTPLGVLALFSKHPISPEEDALLEGIAHLTSQVLHASQAEETIRESSELYHALFEQANDAIFLMENEYFVDCNKRTLEMFGVTREQIINQPPTRFSPEFQADGRRSAEKAMEKIHAAYAGKPQFFEWTHTRLDGTPFDAEVSLGLIKIGGRPLLQAIVRDITERKKTEDALRKNEEFTRRVLESSSDCIKVLDLQGHLLSMSGGGQKLLEIDDIAPYLNSSFIDFWKGKEREGCLEAIAKAKQGDTGIFYGFFATAKGTPKWWEVIITPIKDADGSINRLLAVSRDITERKKAGESIENLNKDLKSTVTQLTQSNRQLREFAHLAAHDLKTPLVGIGTLAQWLVDDYREKFDDEGHQQVDLLVERVGRINKMINAILQYSTITRDEHKEHPIDLNTLVGAILVEIRPPPNIKVTINKNLPVVTCEEMHLQQVFYHLLTNAVNFMDKPEGRIAIDYTDKGDLWEFSVSDNGPGIAPQHFERIFRLFQMLNGPNHSEGSGTGLTFARKIVELYNGQIWLTSELGQGSTFFFTLPKVLRVTNNEKLLLTASS